MMARISSALLLAVSLFGIARPCLAQAVDGFKLTAKESSSCVFGNSELKLQFILQSREAFRGTAVWSARVSQRVLARGETAVESNAAEPGQLVIDLKTPDVRPGVILPVELSIAVSSRRGEAPAVVIERTLWIFPDDPFSDQSAWLMDLKISLFDPPGETAERFKKAGIPFHAMRTTAALRETNEGIIVIGEGTSLTTQRDLAETMLALAAAGRGVVCLAPVAGLLPVPDLEALPEQLPSLHLRGPEAIAELDKRLDSHHWTGVENPVSSSLSWTMQRGRLLAQVLADGRGWPWVEIHDPVSEGRLVACGFGVVRHWDASPVPRYLLAHLLGRVNHSTGNKFQYLEEGGDR